MIFLSVVFLILSGCQSEIKESYNNVKVVGEMKKVMLNGELFGNIDLDTISNKQHLYGLGPIEYLAGELLIIDGKSYKATALSDSSMKVEETFNSKAPIFGYANIDKWNEQNLPDSIRTIKHLEIYLENTTKNLKRPFMFKMSGVVDNAKIHIVNLPKGTKVSTPAEAHQGQLDFKLSNEEVEIVGFFSTEHKAIFTHHDTFLHMHLITADRSHMGHLDELQFKKGAAKLNLPAD